MVQQQTLEFRTRGRGTQEVTAEVQRAVPAYRHDTDGPDDMAAHAHAVLTASSLTLPVSRGRLALGTWQGLYPYEHRSAPHTRAIFVTVMGEA